MKERIAFIIVDAQKDNLPDEEIIQNLVSYADKADVVLVTRKYLLEGAFVKDSMGAKIHPYIADMADYTITRISGSFSAFEGGTLRPMMSTEAILDDEKITTVWVAGFDPNVVSQTALDANAMGYETLVLDERIRAHEKLQTKLEKAGVHVSS